MNDLSSTTGGNGASTRAAVDQDSSRYHFHWARRCNSIHDGSECMEMETSEPFSGEVAGQGILKIIVW